MDVSLRDGTFSAIAFSPDGRRVLVSVQAVGLWLANDPYRELTLRARARFPTHDVRSWNVDTGAEAGGFGGQGGGLRVAQLSRDCRRFAGFCVDGTMRVWDTLTGWNLVTLRPQTMRSTGQTSVIALSDDGKYLASSAATGLEVWDAVAGQNATTIAGHHGPTNDVVFSPDGKHLATTGRDSIVRLWNAESGAATLSFQGNDAVAFSPDSRRVATANNHDGAVRVWDAGSGTQLLEFAAEHAGTPSVSFVCAGTRIAVQAEHAVSVWDSNSGRIAFVIPEQKQPPTRRGAEPAHDLTASVPGGHSPVTLARVFDGSATARTTISPDGRIAATLRGYFEPEFGKEVTIWSLSTGKSLATANFNHGMYANTDYFMFSQDGRRLVEGNPVRRGHHGVGESDGRGLWRLGEDRPLQSRRRSARGSEDPARGRNSPVFYQRRPRGSNPRPR